MFKTSSVCGKFHYLYIRIDLRDSLQEFVSFEENLLLILLLNILNHYSNLIERSILQM